MRARRGGGQARPGLVLLRSPSCPRLVPARSFLASPPCHSSFNAAIALLPPPPEEAQPGGGDGGAGGPAAAEPALRVETAPSASAVANRRPPPVGPCAALSRPVRRGSGLATCRAAAFRVRQRSCRAAPSALAPGGRATHSDGPGVGGRRERRGEERRGEETGRGTKAVSPVDSRRIHCLACSRLVARRSPPTCYSHLHIRALAASLLSLLAPLIPGLPARPYVRPTPGAAAAGPGPLLHAGSRPLFVG